MLFIFLSEWIGLVCQSHHWVEGTLHQGTPTSWPWTGTSCQISGSTRLEIKCPINVLCLNHPETILPPPPATPMEKLSSTILVPGAKKGGDHCFGEKVSFIPFLHLSLAVVKYFI